MKNNLSKKFRSLKLIIDSISRDSLLDELDLLYKELLLEENDSFSEELYNEILSSLKLSPDDEDWIKEPLCPESTITKKFTLLNLLVYIKLWCEKNDIDISIKDLFSFIKKNPSILGEICRFLRDMVIARPFGRGFSGLREDLKQFLQKYHPKVVKPQDVDLFTLRYKTSSGIKWDDVTEYINSLEMFYTEFLRRFEESRKSSEEAGSLDYFDIPLPLSPARIFDFAYFLWSNYKYLIEGNFELVYPSFRPQIPKIFMPDLLYQEFHKDKKISEIYEKVYPIYIARLGKSGKESDYYIMDRTQNIFWKKIMDLHQQITTKEGKEKLVIFKDIVLSNAEWDMYNKFSVCLSKIYHDSPLTKSYSNAFLEFDKSLKQKINQLGHLIVLLELYILFVFVLYMVKQRVAGSQLLYMVERSKENEEFRVNSEVGFRLLLPIIMDYLAHPKIPGTTAHLLLRYLEAKNQALSMLSKYSFFDESIRQSLKGIKEMPFLTSAFSSKLKTFLLDIGIGEGRFREKLSGFKWESSILEDITPEIMRIYRSFGENTFVLDLPPFEKIEEIPITNKIKNEMLCLFKGREKVREEIKREIEKEPAQVSTEIPTKLYPLGRRRRIREVPVVSPSQVPPEERTQEEEYAFELLGEEPEESEIPEKEVPETASDEEWLEREDWLGI